MKSDVSRNILLITLAVRLQRLVKSLPPTHTSAERISKQSLAKAYFSEGLSSSFEGAQKKAQRYLHDINTIFSLTGDEKSGFEMTKRFETFREMFAYWLEKINPPSKHDKRLHIMLQGLIYAIDNAFNDDPIAIPRLAQQLKANYGNANVRDSREPLTELFDNNYISGWLGLIETDCGKLGIEKHYDPLLLRLRPRSEIGNNADQSINLVRGGRIHVIFEHVLKDLPKAKREHAKSIAESIKTSTIWRYHEQPYLPYLLFREGAQGPVILTMRNLEQHYFEDINIEDLKSIPASLNEYIPYDMNQKAWHHFKHMLQ